MYRKSSKEGYLINETVDIRIDYATKEVVVVEDGKEIFRKPKNENNTSLAFSIYMGAKYREEKGVKDGE